MTDFKRDHDSGPAHMMNRSWERRWIDSEGCQVAVVMWDTSIEYGTVISAWVDKGEHPRVQVELDDSRWVTVHPRWVYVDWGGPDGRGLDGDS